MATRFYTDPINAPSVSPAYDAGWDETAAAVRRKLVIDTAGNNGSVVGIDTDTIAAAGTYLLWQFVSEPMDAATYWFTDIKVNFRCAEENAKLNGFLRYVIGKCDEDGGNRTSYDSYNDNVEFLDDYDTIFQSRNIYRAGSTIAFNQGDRLVVDVGFYSSATKAGGYIGAVVATDNHATDDLPVNDTETAAYNSWIETGATFTEASGDPPEVVKFGPMFTFA